MLCAVLIVVQSNGDEVLKFTKFISSPVVFVVIFSLWRRLQEYKRGEESEPYIVSVWHWLHTQQAGTSGVADSNSQLDTPSTGVNRQPACENHTPQSREGGSFQGFFEKPRETKNISGFVTWASNSLEIVSINSAGAATDVGKCSANILITAMYTNNRKIVVDTAEITARQ